MNRNELAADNGTDDSHRDLIATDEDHVIDANATHVATFDGAGTVIFAQTFERTEHGLRFAGDAPVFTAAVESEHALRESLAGAGYRTTDVERALRDDHRLTDGRADAAARAAGGRVAMADGGTETHRVWIADCDDCGWQSAHDNKADAENARFAHEDTAQTGTGGPWHQAIVRWEDVTDDDRDVVTDGGEPDDGETDDTDSELTHTDLAGVQLEDSTGDQISVAEVHDDKHVTVVVYPADRSRDSYEREWSEGRVVHYLRDGVMTPKFDGDAADYLAEVATDGGTEPDETETDDAETCDRCPTLLADVHATHEATTITTDGEELCPECADARCGVEIGYGKCEREDCPHCDGPRVMADGGRDLSGDHPLDVQCRKCEASYRIDETVTNECPECGFTDFEIVDPDPKPDVVTDGGQEAR